MSYTSHSNSLTSNLLNLVDSYLVECSSNVSCDDNVDSAVNYHLSSGGNKIRAKLTLEACHRLGIHENDAVVMAAAIECLHNASLVHDDLMDGDEYRRKKQAVWHKYNSQIAICAGDMMIARAFGILSHLTYERKIGECLHMLREVTETTIEGQSADINSQTWHNLTTSQYCDTVALKSVPLLQICMAMPLSYAGIRIHEQMLNSVFNPFASAYQIIDDIEDWQQDHAHDRCNYLSLLTKESANYHSADLYYVAFQDAEKLLENSRFNESQLPPALIGLMAPYTQRLKLKMQALQKEHIYD
jgi:geranylgeranyl diphosphate synthase type II